MVLDDFAIVFGDEVMGLYCNGELVTAATKLTFGDVLEGCGINCDLIEADLELYNEPEKLPKLLKELVVETEA